MLKLPTIIVNFKTYETSIGDKAVDLAKICDKIAKEEEVSIAVAVTAADLYRVSQEVSIPVFVQHIDEGKFGSHTGDIIAENAKSNGAVGTLLNHSEKRLRLDVLSKTIHRAKENGLIAVVCANDSDEGKAVSSLNADFIAVEPPELIGGDISVSTAQPELIKESVHKICGGVKCEQVLVGAGVKTSEDIKIARELGAVGVLLASGITKADDPEKALRELAKGLK